jgi:hypothetical protein
MVIGVISTHSQESLEAAGVSATIKDFTSVSVTANSDGSLRIDLLHELDAR